jgi:hypothetical protein
MINFIKEFLLYLKIKKNIVIDWFLNKDDKIHLQSISREIENKINSYCYQKLCDEMVNNNLTPEFIRGSKFIISIREWLFRDYHIIFNKK